MPDAPEAFVLDASVAASWILPDEDAAADPLLDALERGEGLVPDLFWHEVRNILVMAERRGRLGPGGAGEAIGLLRRLPIRLGDGIDDATILAAAIRYGLTAYDAAYLSLAAAEGATLATLDRALGRAGRQAGIDVLPAP